MVDFFKWQAGYRAFTVSKNLVDFVKTYIEHQEQHHVGNDLQQEGEQTTLNEQIW
jgi:putative transposase